MARDDTYEKILIRIKALDTALWVETVITVETSRTEVRDTARLRREAILAKRASLYDQAQRLQPPPLPPSATDQEQAT